MASPYRTAHAGATAIHAPKPYRASGYDADARAFQRHVDPGIMLHGRSSMRLGAATADAVQTHHHSQGRPPERIIPVPPARQVI